MVALMASSHHCLTFLPGLPGTTSPTNCWHLNPAQGLVLRKAIRDTPNGCLLLLLGSQPRGGLMGDSTLKTLHAPLVTVTALAESVIVLVYWLFFLSASIISLGSMRGL